ncbi:MAG TPA: hypothetical protein VN678_07535 [Acidobacteriaceae bacterium]|nr:hypothetical protein [Acidobacteriaceae bacterium]
MKLAIRSNAHYIVFGVPAEDDTGKPNRKWREVGSDDENDRLTWLRLDIYPLHRGPEGNPRFLAKFIESGCAGSVGVSYDIREWTPTEFGSFDQVIKISGAFGWMTKFPGSRKSES